MTSQPNIIESKAPHTHIVVFLHGRGDTSKSFALSLKYSRDSKNRHLLELFPSFRWVFPQAPMLPTVTLGGRHSSQWFDIWNSADLTENEDHQAAGLRESVNNMRTLLQNEADILGGRWDHIVLAGISQGGASSVHTLLNLSVPSQCVDGGQQGPCRLGAFLGFSCRMPFPGKTVAETRKILGLEGVPETDGVIRNTPVLLEHCADDDVVPLNGGQKLRDQLRGYGAQVVWKEYSNGAHWFKSPEGIDDVVEFLNSVLGLSETRESKSAQVQVLPVAMDLS